MPKAVSKVVVQRNKSTMRQHSSPKGRAVKVLQLRELGVWCGRVIAAWVSDADTKRDGYFFYTLAVVERRANPSAWMPDVIT